jgi:DNA-3-methyladenine glycosylase I
MTQAARLHADGLTCCPWPGDDPLYLAYHDTEWGRPEYDDRALFEKLILDGFQAGLSWITILRKRDNFSRAFDDFNPEKIARYGDKKIHALMNDTGIVRNRAKIEATIANAHAMVALREAGTSLGELVWAHRPEPRPAPQGWGEVPAQTPESKALSRELKARGFRFVGPTTVYAAMQACGLVNDHLAGCPARPATEAAQAAGSSAGAP